MSAAAPPSAPPVKRRRVYYISGFDPRGARFYHQLYRHEATLQQGVNGVAYMVGARQKSGAYATAWDVEATPAGTGMPAMPTTTRYSFLGWDDLIRTHWPSGSAQVIAAMPAFYWRYAAGGGLRRTLRCAPRYFWSLLSPLIWLLASLLMALLLAGAGAAIARLVGAPAWLAALAGVLPAAALLRAALAGAEKLRLLWLMRIFLFVPFWGRQRPAALDQRWTAFAAQIEADLAADAARAEPADEVLLVGHSVGALVAVAVADALLARADAAAPPRLKLLSLGNITPMLAFVPEAGWFREQLARVGASAIAWKDISAPSDPLCYALVDPFATCGLAAPGGAGFELKSARFDRMFAGADYAARRRDPFGIHFQYLMASALPVDNDYFTLTAGPAALSVRGAEAGA